MIIDYIVNNEAVIGEAIAGIVATASALNRLLPADKGPKWLHAILDRVGGISKRGMVGILGTPVTVPMLTRSQPKKLPKINDEVSDDVTK